MEGSLQFTLSARGKRKGQPVLGFLAQHYGHVPLDLVDSVFGFVEACTLYGGRPWLGAELSTRDAEALQERGIGLRLPLSTHTVSPEEYERARPLLERHHRPGSSLILVHDELARWIRRDFPHYQLEASVIKAISTPERLSRALALYDTVVLPMDLLDQTEVLAGLGPKERLRLFASVGCAYNCPAKTCYPNISRSNKLLCSTNPAHRAWGLASFPFTVGCSRSKKKRARLGMRSFELERLTSLGYTRFKLMRSHAARESCR